MTGRMIIALILILLGLSALFNFSFWRLLWPLLLIVLGLSLLFRTGWSDQRDWAKGDSKQEIAHEKALNYSAVFAPLNKKVITDGFTGGKIDVVFGGGEVDLRDAKIKKGQTARLEVNAVFGGIKIIAPKTWSVESNLTGVFGGFENKVVTPAAGKEQGKLILKGSAVFGGGEVTN